MPAEKVCKNCKRVYEGSECPGCQSRETASSFKGKIIITNPDESEVKQKGIYAVKLG